MATPGNPLGAICLLDGDNPRIFTAKAREAISGGEFVFVSGDTALLSSGADSYAVSDITVALSASNVRFNGIALANTGSAGTAAVATRGAYILLCGGSVFGGTLVETIGDSVAVQSLSSGAVPTGMYTGIMSGKIIGRAMTDGASGGFALIDIHA